MRKETVFGPITRKPRAFKIAAFDVEGDGGERGFMLGAAFADGQFHLFRKPRDMVAFFRQDRFASYRFYGHLLTYDYGVLMDAFPEGHECLLMRGKVFKVSVPVRSKRAVYLADSLGLMANMPLAEVGQAIGLRKYPPPPEIVPEGYPTEEWYCEAHHRLWCLECYNLRDVEIVQRAVSLFQDTLLELGGELGWTLASTAMKLFRMRYMCDEYPVLHPYRNLFARDGYYGGRTEAFRKGHWPGLTMYDVNSMYPYVMLAFEYPDPGALVGPTVETSLSVIMEREGLSEVTIEIPFMPIPPLPFRHGDKLYFPYGRMRGIWTHVELREALRHGAKIIEIHRSLYSRSTVRPFVSYVRDLYRLRQEAKERGDPRQLVFKVLMNSLYGKLAQRNDGALERLVRTSELGPGKDMSGMLPIIFNDALYLRDPIVSEHDPVFVVLPWAAYVSAYARVHLFRLMERCDFDVYYCDTDSIITPCKLPTSRELGGVSIVYENCDFQLVTQKMYAGYKDGQLAFAKCKGVPRDRVVDYITYRHVAFYKAIGLWEGARRGIHPSAWAMVERTFRDTDPKRRYIPVEGSDNGRCLSIPWEASAIPG